MSRSDAIQLSRDQVRGAREVYQSLVEKAYHMRVVAHLADRKGQLLVQTIREVDKGKVHLRNLNEQLYVTNRFLQGQAQSTKAHVRLIETLESLSDGYAIFDADKRLLVSNRIYREFWRAIDDLIVPGTPVTTMIEALATRKAVIEEQDRIDEWVRETTEYFRNAEGNSREFHLAGGRWLRVAAHKTREAGTLLICSDITDDKKRDQALRHSQKLEAIGQLTGGIAHDFNNMLTAVLTNLQLLKNGIDDDSTKRKLLEATINTARRGADLTKRMLAFSRHQELKPTSVDVKELIGGMMDLLTRALGESVDFETVFPDDLWRAKADSNLLESALLNLVLNSRDAIPESGKITITGRNANIVKDRDSAAEQMTPGPYVAVTVEDSGSGMSTEVAERAFEPFFTTKGVGEGSGLGLSMVYGYVMQSGGHIEIDSVPGRGTTMTMYFPSTNKPADEILQPASNLDTIFGSGEVVLVTEDDADVRDSISTLLSFNGYHVIEAEDGPAALAILEKDSKIDLLITDVMLPKGINGLELAEEFRKHDPNVKVLLTTGYTDLSASPFSKLEADTQILSKPYEIETLLTKVRQILDRANT